MCVISPRCQVLRVQDPNDVVASLTQELARNTESNPQSLFLADGNSRQFPQSGILRHFLRIAEDDKYSKREVVAVVIFASEGDNTADAKELGGCVLNSLPSDATREVNEGVTKEERLDPGRIEWIYPEGWAKAFGDGPRVGAEGGLFW
jgi:hypothetical protein